MTRDQQAEIKMLIAKLAEVANEQEEFGNNSGAELQKLLPTYSANDIEIELRHLRRYVDVNLFTNAQLAKLILYGQNCFVHGRMTGRKDIQILQTKKKK